MRRVSGRTLWVIFSIAVVVMLLIAIAVDRTSVSYAASEYRVSHTQQVITRLIDLRADLLSAEAARLVYVVSGDESELPVYEESMRQIPDDLDMLQKLTADNHGQQERLAVLRPLVEQRIGLLRESVDLGKKGSTDAAQQEKLTESGADLAHQIRAILDDAESNEQALLKQRQSFSEDTYAWARRALMIAFFATTIILLTAFAKLLVELRNREQAEAAVRALSGQILRIQDEERRRIARELHDSLGQLLSSAKMSLDHLKSAPPANPEEARDLIATACDLVEQSIAETRTLSYLLHPPLLDEFGFASAAKWYIEGFSARSKIEVKIDVDSGLARMPGAVELALFRLLQESLTNIHRHSGSATAEVHLLSSGNSVTLTVTDHGKGIPLRTLEKFEKAQGGLGVGLAGMRERVHQLGGKMKIASDPNATVVDVTIPLRDKDLPAKKTFSTQLQENPGSRQASTIP
jgi:signal transduction histidine kinase